jgi:hypothetical protein
VGDVDIPAEETIKTLPLGDLITLRNTMLAALGEASPRYLTTYEEILTDTIALAVLIDARRSHEAELPPEPAWVDAIDEIEPRWELRDTPSDPNAGSDLMPYAGLNTAELDHFDDLDDPEVEYRLAQLIAIDKTDDEIWAILKTEFTLREE